MEVNEITGYTKVKTSYNDVGWVFTRHVDRESGSAGRISEKIEVTMRTGPSTSNAIILMISSGTSVTMIKGDPESGYSLVRTDGSVEGWVKRADLKYAPTISND